MIGHDNLEEFADPANYDVEEGAATEAPARFYGDLAARLGGTVLEIACGTGLVTIRLAERGFKTTGTDICRPMLDHARRKAAARGLAVDWIEADARRLALEGRFDFVYLTGNAFQAFLTDADQDALLSSVARHLAPGGLFAFETRNPGGHDLSEQREECLWHRYTRVDGHAVTVSGTQHYDAASAVMHWTSFRRWQAGGAPRLTVSRIACRFTGVDQLSARLKANGFDIAACHGDFDGRPLTARCPSIVMVCRAV